MPLGKTHTSTPFLFSVRGLLLFGVVVGVGGDGSGVAVAVGLGEGFFSGVDVAVGLGVAEGLTVGITGDGVGIGFAVRLGVGSGIMVVSCLGRSACENRGLNAIPMPMPTLRTTAELNNSRQPT